LAKPLKGYHGAGVAEEVYYER